MTPEDGWLRRAVIKQRGVNLLAERGLGVPKELRKGKELARMAAEGGDSDAIAWIATHALDSE